MTEVSEKDQARFRRLVRALNKAIKEIQAEHYDSDVNVYLDGSYKLWLMQSPIGTEDRVKNEFQVTYEYLSAGGGDW